MCLPMQEIKEPSFYGVCQSCGISLNDLTLGLYVRLEIIVRGQHLKNQFEILCKECMKERHYDF